MSTALYSSYVASYQPSPKRIIKLDITALCISFFFFFLIGSDLKQVRSAENLQQKTNNNRENLVVTTWMCFFGGGEKEQTMEKKKRLRPSGTFIFRIKRFDILRFIINLEKCTSSRTRICPLRGIRKIFCCCTICHWRKSFECVNFRWKFTF